MSALTTSILNLLFAEAEQKGKTRHFRTYIGLGSDGSRFNPWDTAITHQPEWRPVSKTELTQYDPSGSWCIEQGDVCLDDVKTSYHRRMRCVTVVYPYFVAQRDTDLVAECAHLSCAKICIDVSRFSPDLYKDKRATWNRRQKNGISDNEASRNLLTNIILHVRTSMYMMISAIGAGKKAVGYSFKMLDPGKNGVQSSDNSSMKFKYEFVFG